MRTDQTLFSQVCPSPFLQQAKVCQPSQLYSSVVLAKLFHQAILKFPPTNLNQLTFVERLSRLRSRLLRWLLHVLSLNSGTPRLVSPRLCEEPFNCEMLRMFGCSGYGPRYFLELRDCTECCFRIPSLQAGFPADLDVGQYFGSRCAQTVSHVR